MYDGPKRMGESRLDEIIADYLTAEESGHPLDRETLIAAHPHVANQLRSFFADQDRLHAMLVEEQQPQAPPRIRYFGDYELQEEIARGGMGAVYKALQTSLNRTVAVKMILGSPWADSDDLKRFRTEAQAAATLQHAGIVSVHEVGIQDGLHYFSMDYVEGRSLAELMSEAPIPPLRAARYVKQMAEAAHFAHQNGFLHRDLKPSNVLIDLQDSVKITDFGLARKVHADSRLTQTGQIIGTPRYMSPEQAQAKHGLVGPASDVYAMGAILYELLTGRPPFQAEATLEALRHVIETDPRSPRLLNPSLSKDLTTICLKCLEKEPHRRYPTAQHLADELSRHLNRKPITARPVGYWARLWRWSRRNPVVASLSACLGMLLMITAIVTSLAAIRFQNQRDTLAAQRHELQNRQKELEKTNQKMQSALWRSYLQQAQASRWSGRLGQRFASLEALRRAAQIRPSQKLRNEAVASMALVDFQPVMTREWSGEGSVVLDTNLELLAEHTTGQIVIRRLKDDREIARLPGMHAAPGTVMLDFGPRGRYLATRTRAGTLHLWHIGNKRRVLRVPSASNWTFDFSPDGTLLAVGRDDRSVRVYELRQPENASHRNLVPGDPSMPTLRGVRFSPSGDRLAVVRQRSIDIYRRRDGVRIRRLVCPESAGGRCAWSSGGQMLAANIGTQLLVWELVNKTEKPSLVLEGHKNGGLKMTFHPNAPILASTGWDGTTCLWSVASGKLLLRPEQKFRGFSADGKRAVFVTGNEVQVCRFSTGAEYRTLLPGDNRQKSAAFGPNGRIMATAGRDGVRLWDAHDFHVLAHLPIGFTHWVAFRPERGDFITSGTSGLQRWPLRRVSTDVEEIHLGPPDPLPLPVRATPRRGDVTKDGSALIVDFDRDLRAVIVRWQGSSRTTHVLETGNNHSVAISPNGRWAASGTWHGSEVRVWDVPTGRRAATIGVPGHAGVRFSPDGRWLVVSVGGEHRFHRVAAWSCDHVIGQWTETIPAPIAWSPNQKMVAIGVERTLVRLIESRSGRELVTFNPKKRKRFGHGNKFCFSPDGAHLVLLGRGLHVWDLRAVRERLAELNLDWNAEPLPPRPKGLPSQRVRILQVKE